MILLDTHILIWLDQGSERLGVKARRTLEKALPADELGIASITFWEIAMLLDKGRVLFQGDLNEWRVELINAGFNEQVLDPNVALQAGFLKGFHGDPADRLIAATALHTGSRLMTADKRLLDYRKLRTINGTK